MIMVRNNLTGEFECCYWTQLISRAFLHLNLSDNKGHPGVDWELTDWWTKQVPTHKKTHSRTVNQVSYLLIKLTKTFRKPIETFKTRLDQISQGCTVDCVSNQSLVCFLFTCPSQLPYFEKEIMPKLAWQWAVNPGLWIEHVVCSELQLLINCK